MDGSDFTQLLDEFGCMVTWEQAFPCPCTLDTGSADRSCQICSGKARYYGDASEPFEACILNQTSRERAAMAQSMGPGEMGDSTLVVFDGAPCFERISDGDRIWDTSKMDIHRIVLRPGTLLTLPPSFCELHALVKSSDGTTLVNATPPAPDSSRRVRVSVPTRLDFTASRGYEVILDLARIRTFGEGLPKRISLRRIEFSAR